MTITLLEEGITAYLQANAGLVALISTRVYWRKIPQSATLPCLTFVRVDTPRTLTMDTSGKTGDLINPRFQFDAWATTYTAAKAISDALRAALNGHTGTTGTGITIRAALADNEVPDDGGDPNTGLERVRSEYIIWQEEA